MATEILDEPLAEEMSSGENPKPKRRIDLSSKKVRILLLLVLVMGIEAAGFYLLVPSPVINSSTKDDQAGEATDVETVEIVIGDFTPTNGIAAPGSRINVECKVTAIVAKSQEVAFDLAANKKHKQSVKAAVEQVLSSASLPELVDPRRSVIRRKIREEINKVLRKSFVNEVILTDFRYINI